MACFLCCSIKRNKSTFQFGARLDTRQLEVTDPNFKRFFFSPNFSAGWNREGEFAIVHLNLSTGYRPPHVSELFANGEHHGASRYEIGTADLEPEKSTQIELSYELKRRAC